MKDEEGIRNFDDFRRVKGRILEVVKEGVLYDKSGEGGSILRRERSWRSDEWGRGVTRETGEEESVEQRERSMKEGKWRVKRRSEMTNKNGV